MHVKMDDKVIILTGKDADETGKIIAIDNKHGRVKVERRNMVVKHKRPNALLEQEGARVEQENWIDVSNVGLYNEELGSHERTSNRFVGAGNELFESKFAARASFGDDTPSFIQKVRVGKRSGHVYDELKAN